MIRSLPFLLKMNHFQKDCLQSRCSSRSQQEEWNQIKKQIKEEGKEKIQFFLGARRNSGEKEYYWVDEDNEFTGDRLDNNDEQWCKDVWLKGEPSYYDSMSKKMKIV